MVDHLRSLIEVETPSTDTKYHGELLSILEDDFRNVGFTSRRVPGIETGDHLYARPDSMDQIESFQLLIGHADTVWPIGTLRDNPARIEDGKIYGPGAYDMKAGLTTIVYALKIIDDLDLQPSITPLILINTDEEIGSPDSIRLIKRLARLSNRNFVLEPSGPDDEACIARKGSAHFEIEIEGKAAHAGIEPEEGANAIHAMSDVIDRLRSIDSEHEEGTVNVGVIEGGIQGNVVAPHCQIEVDARATTAEMAEDIEAQIRSLTASIEGTTATIEGGFRQPPMERSTGAEQLFETARSLSSELGFELIEESSGGASDGNTASQYAPTLDGLGPSGDGAHQENEYVKVDSLPERVALLAALLLKN